MMFLMPWPAAEHPPLWSAPIFNTAPQLLYLLISIPSGVAGAAVWSSSRTMLTAVAPTDNVGAFFGLAALSGAATAWLAPALVQVATSAFHSQQSGMLPIAGLFLAGIVVLLLVRNGEGPSKAAVQT